MWRGLDLSGMLAYAADVARERTHENIKRVRFAEADERHGVEALAMVDQITAHGQSERLDAMRRLIAEAC